MVFTGVKLKSNNGGDSNGDGNNAGTVSAETVGSEGGTSVSVRENETVEDKATDKRPSKSNTRSVRRKGDK